MPVFQLDHKANGVGVVMIVEAPSLGDAKAAIQQLPEYIETRYEKDPEIVFYLYMDEINLDDPFTLFACDDN